MTSNVDVTTREAYSIMLIEAMVRTSKNSKALAEKFDIPYVPLQMQYVKVELKINDVEVDFVKTAEEMWNRLNSRYEQDVLEKAKELVGQSRYQNLMDIIEQHEFELQRELERLFAVTSKKFADN